MLFAFVNLLAGIIAGLIRMGWTIPVGSVAAHHGAIMVGGFLSTLILLEKVIPLKNKHLFLFPLINALSLLMIFPEFYPVARLFLLTGAVGLLFVFILYLRRQPADISLLLMAAGACCLITGHTLLIVKRFYPMVFPWWMGFVLFIIVGERMELTKFLPVPKQRKNLLVGLMVLFLLGLLLPFHGAGRYVSGISLVAIAAWLLRYDVISIAIGKNGVTRFSAIALSGGYISLMLTGALVVSLPDLPFAYDAMVHTFFIGFTFSMIFAHGPVILPGVLALKVRPYHSMLYLPLGGILLSLILRVLADVMVLPFPVRPFSGWITAGSIMLYFAMLFINTIRRIRYENAV